jgi:DNA-binding NtrC family response regulator
MARPMIVLVSDNREHHEKVKAYGTSMGYSVQCFMTNEWGRGLQEPTFRQALGADLPSLAAGSSPLDSGAKILQFPTGGSSGTGDKKVRTINELESLAIENAIHEYNGNLTEAAKALGIGRATLYRKVKQYNIDPTNARKKKVA